MTSLWASASLFNSSVEPAEAKPSEMTLNAIVLLSFLFQCIGPKSPLGVRASILKNNWRSEGQEVIHDDLLQAATARSPQGSTSAFSPSMFITTPESPALDFDEEGLEAIPTVHDLPTAGREDSSPPISPSSFLTVPESTNFAFVDTSHQDFSGLETLLRAQTTAENQKQTLVPPGNCSFGFVT